MSSQHVTELNDATFDTFLASTTKPVLVDFWAPWCGPCRALGPVVEEVATENSDKFAVAKVNVDDAPTVSTTHGIRSIPALFFFKDGVKKDSVVGVQGKAEILRRLEALV